MNFITISNQLKKAGGVIMMKHDRDGKNTFQTESTSNQFLKQLCVLIPADFLLTSNLFWSPPTECFELIYQGLSHAEYMHRRCSDVKLMVDRVLLWYEQKFPEGIEGVDEQALMELKEWFGDMRRVTNAQLKHFEPAATERNTSRRQEAGHNGQSHKASRGYYASNRCECVWICFDCPANCCFYSCRYCIRGIIDIESSRYRNVVVANQVSGSGYKGGIAGAFTGEYDGYLQASGNEQCHHLCEQSCGREFASNCCFCYQSDKGVAAAINGGSAPQNCCGQIGFYSAKSIENCRSCYCQCFGDIWQGCFSCGKGLSHNLCSANENACTFLAHCFDLDTVCRGVSCNSCIDGICSTCSNSNCGSCAWDFKCDKDIGKAICGFFGFCAGVVGISVDATSTDSNSGGGDSVSGNSTQIITDYGTREEHFSRLLRNETSSEYTPSIVFMAFAIAVFAPRIIGNLSYALINIKQGTGFQRNFKVVFGMLFVGLPLSILVSWGGGASRWTYATLAFMFMHFSYRIIVYPIKAVHPELCELSYLSCAAWRKAEFSGTEDRSLLASNISSITAPLLIVKKALKDEQLRLNNVFCGLNLVFSAIMKAMARLNLSDMIKDAHLVNRTVIYSDVPVLSAPILDIAEPLEVGQMEVLSEKMEERDI